MRRLTMLAGSVTALLAGAGALAAVSRIAPMLPTEGASRCFSGNYDGSTGLTFGFPSQKRTDEAHVTRLLLRLDHAPGQERHRDPMTSYHFDWRYDFRIVAETSDRGQFVSGGQCDWTDDAIANIQPAIYCFIDCDGGGIEISRTPARQSVNMVWDADGWLRMGTCGGGSEILRAGATSKTFRLETAPDDECKNMPQSDG